MVLYGQIVIGAPGAGKTTFCDGMQQYLRLLGRDCWVVNLDPANEVPPSFKSSNETSTLTPGAPAEDLNFSEVQNQDPQEEGDDKDDANSQLPYETILDVCQDVISLEKVMTELQLGPNGGLLYCMEYIERHLSEVLKLLRERLYLSRDGDCQQSPRPYLVIDLPGQIEITAHSSVVSRIARRLVRELDLRLVCVQLVDAAVCLTDVSKFIGAALVCTASMMRLELPCVNILSKMDLLQQCAGVGAAESLRGGKDRQNESDDEEEYGYGNSNGTFPLPFNLQFFTQCHDLGRLVDYLDSNTMDFAANQDKFGDVDPLDYLEDSEYQEARNITRSSNFARKYRKLHHELCDLVDDFGLLSFLPLSIVDAESVGRVVARVDKCNGFVFLKDAKVNDQVGGNPVSNVSNMQDLFSSAMVADAEWSTGVLSDVQEKFLGELMFHEEISELGK